MDGIYVDSVDISKPIILAEISPGQYNVIDGNHRVKKARKNGVEILSAYKLKPEQHINFGSSGISMDSRRRTDLI